MIKIGTIRMKSGTEAIFVSEFNEGYSHIIADDGCWVVVNGISGEAMSSAWIFPEAKAELDQLPASPTQHGPYLERIGAKQSAQDVLKREDS